MPAQLVNILDELRQSRMPERAQGRRQCDHQPEWHLHVLCGVQIVQVQANLISIALPYSFSDGVVIPSNKIPSKRDAHFCQTAF